MTAMPPPPDGNQPEHQQGYQAAPQYAYQGGHGGPVMTSAPPSIVRAKYAMWAGAALQLLGLIPLFLMQDDLRALIKEQMVASGQALDPSVVDAGIALAMVVGVVQALIGVALWLFIAYFTGKGKEWARIVGTVLFVIFVLLTLFSFVQPTLGLAMVLSLITLVVAAAATFFLWQKDSTAWFKAHKAPTV